MSPGSLREILPVFQQVAADFMRGHLGTIHFAFCMEKFQTCYAAADEQGLARQKHLVLLLVMQQTHDTKQRDHALHALSTKDFLK